MPEFPSRNVISRPAIETDGRPWLNSDTGQVVIPVNTLRSIAGYLLAVALKDEWQPAETYFIENYFGGCE